MENGRSYSFDIASMLVMYGTGEWTYKGLARHFGKDHTTIMYHVRRAGIPTVNKPGGVVGQVRKTKRPRVDLAVVRFRPSVAVVAPRRAHKYDYLLYENDVIKAPKSYAVLLREAKERTGGKWYRTFAPYRGVRRVAVTEVSTEKKRGRFDPEDLSLVQEKFDLVIRDRNQSDSDELDTGIGANGSPEASTTGRVERIWPRPQTFG